MSIITIATSKGGAGKTTVARLILAWLARAGFRVAAVDADFNHTLSDWVRTASKQPIDVEHELDETQELNYRFIAKTIADLGFNGYIAHEYRPSPGKDPIKDLEQAFQILTV